MPQLLQLDGIEYDISELSDRGKNSLRLVQFSKERIQELKNMQSIMHQTRAMLIEKLKAEMVSQIGGFILDND